MTEKRRTYETVPIPRVRLPVIDSLAQGRRMSPMHLLLEVDVTDTRHAIRDYRRRAGEPLSLTSYLTWCLARTVDEDRVVQAYRRGRKLVIATDVDVSVIMEREIGDEQAPLFPYIVKAANRKTPVEIQREIRAAQTADAGPSRASRWLNLYWYLPGFVRSLLWSILLRSPTWRMKLTGTVALSAVGMFGAGAGWGIPVPTYTLSITVGGISEKPGIVNGQTATREYLCLSISIDHNVVDGAPAARFARRFKDLVESARGLKE